MSGRSRYEIARIADWAWRELHQRLGGSTFDMLVAAEILLERTIQGVKEAEDMAEIVSFRGSTAPARTADRLEELLDWARGQIEDMVALNTNERVRLARVFEVILDEYDRLGEDRPPPDAA